MGPLTPRQSHSTIAMGAWDSRSVLLRKSLLAFRGLNPKPKTLIGGLCALGSSALEIGLGLKVQGLGSGALNVVAFMGLFWCCW